MSFQHYAARSGHSQVCSFLLLNGACVNAQTRSGDVTPLHRAAYCGCDDVIDVLLKNGSDVMLQDDDGQTALHKVKELFFNEVRCIACHLSSHLNY